MGTHAWVPVYSSVFFFYKANRDLQLKACGNVCRPKTQLQFHLPHDFGLFQPTHALSHMHMFSYNQGHRQAVANDQTVVRWQFLDTSPFEENVLTHLRTTIMYTIAVYFIMNLCLCNSCKKIFYIKPIIIQGSNLNHSNS